MNVKLEWQSEDEGRIFVLENKRKIFEAEVFVTGEEEAELRILDVVFLQKTEENKEKQEKVIFRMIKCLKECFRLLWEEGLEAVALVEPAGTKIAEILDSTKVVQIAYKEYMMKNSLEPQKTTGCGQNTLLLTKEEEGFCCEDGEHDFFCRLLPYGPESSDRREFYLYEVEVVPSKRNRGIARRCLTELFGRLQEEGPVVIYLQVGSYNEPALHLYKTMGFTVAEELRYYAFEEE